MNNWITKKKFNLLLIIYTLFLLLFSWFVSNPMRAAKIDRYVLYSIDDIFHYCYVRTASINPLALLNPYAKPLYTLIGTIFYNIFPFGLLSLRIMNSLFSVATLLVLGKLMKKMRVEELYIFLAIAMTALFPIYFLASISALTEIMFAFVLILAIYLFYCKRWLGSVLAVSLLPLIRQEGLLFLFIWSLFVIKNKKIKYLVFIFLPTILWVFLNWFIWNRPVIYSLLHQIYFIIAKINQTPPSQTVGSFFGATSFMIILYQPLFILSVIGWWRTLQDRSYRLISACWGFYVFFLLSFYIGHIIIFRTVSRELRYIVPFVPIMILYSVLPIKTIISSFGLTKKHVKVLFFGLFGIILIWATLNLRLLQEDVKVNEDALTPRNEREIEEITFWLNSYLKKNSINSIYVSGRFTTNKYIRRIWMNLDKDVRFYPTIDPYATEPKGEIKPLDIVNFDILRNSDIKGVFLIFNVSDNDRLGRQIDWVLIKSFPDIPLNFYLTGKTTK